MSQVRNDRPIRALLKTVPLLALAIATSPLPAQAPPSPSATPAAPATAGPILTLHATARLVILDVAVTGSDGHPLKNLKSSDFTLTEDGVEQHILNVTEHDVTDAVPNTTTEPLPPNTFAPHVPIAAEIPKVVIVLDSLSFVDSPYVRDEVRAFMKTLAPGTPISIFRIDWQGLHLVQSLTTDPAVLQEAAFSQRILPPLGFPVRNLHRVGSPVQQLASYLAAVPGRINVVWFGETPPGGLNEGLFPNLSSAIPPALAAFVAGQNAIPSALRLSRVAIYPITASGLMGNFGPPPDIFAAARDFGGTSTFGFSGAPMDALGAGKIMSGCQELMEMANSTGGKAYCNTNGFKEALADVVASGSHFYTLAYSPTNGDWNGKYRHIKIDVVPVAPITAWDKLVAWINPLNGKVLYRNGYFARPAPEPRSNPAPTPTPANQSTAPPREQRQRISYSPKGDSGGASRRGPTPLEAAMSFAMPTPFQLPFLARLIPSSKVETVPPGAHLPKGNFLNPPWHDQPFHSITVHYWIDPKDLHLAPHGDAVHDTLELVTVIYRDDGATVNSLATVMPIDIDSSQLDTVLQTGVGFDQTIAVPTTGNFFLRVGVQELTSNRIGVVELPSEWIKLPSPQTTAAAHPLAH